MKRTVDPSSVVTQVRALEGVISGIVSKYQAYHAEVGATVKSIMEKAGVWDEVHDLERERERVRQQADQKIKAAQAEIEKLNQVYTWLMGQGGAEAPEVPEAIEAPVPSEEAAKAEPVKEAEPVKKAEPVKVEPVKVEPVKVEPEPKAEEKMTSRPKPPVF